MTQFLFCWFSWRGGKERRSSKTLYRMFISLFHYIEDFGLPPDSLARAIVSLVRTPKQVKAYRELARACLRLHPDGYPFRVVSVVPFFQQDLGRLEIGQENRQISQESGVEV